jgi:hypothetical protein
VCSDDRYQNQKSQDGRSTLKSKIYTLVIHIIEPSSTNNVATKELRNYWCLKFENCHFTVTAAKDNK